MEEELKIIRKKERKKILPIICIVLAVILLAGGGYYYYTNYYHKDEPVEEKNTQPNLKDDFYENINFGNDKVAMSDAQLSIITNQSEVGIGIENDPNYKNDNYFTFFELFDDMEEREKRGLDDLKPYFDAIDNAKTIDEFSDIVIKVTYDLGINSFINFGISKDFYDNSKNVLYFQPMVLENLKLYTLNPLAQSGFEFFSNDEFSIYKKAFEKARIKYFKQYGYDEEKATNLSNEITNFAKTIQEKSLPLDELKTNYIDHFKNATKQEIKNIFKNLPIDKFLAKYNLSNYQYFATFDEGHLKALDDYYTEEHLPLMKEILRLLILENIASIYTSSDYAKIFASAFSSLAGGVVTYDQLLTYYENTELKPTMMGSYLNTKYDEKYFTESDKKEVRELTDKIINYYNETIKKTDWLDDSTKTEALKKLDNLGVNIGYTKKNEIASNVKLVNKENGGSLISNYILLQQDDSKKISKIIKEKYNEELSQFYVNAFYDPQENAITMLSGYREVYRDITDKYEFYGYLGVLLAHEISHAFDNNGSRFDEKGNIRNWWTDNDKEDYNKLKQKIVDYYSNYEVYGIKINGEKTVGENIADLAAVKTILNIMEGENATNDDYKKFFEAYAKCWYDNTPKEQLEIVMLSDEHSPNKARVNAVLSSMDKFYEVYDIKEGDKMYVAKENRVGLW